MKSRLTFEEEVLTEQTQKDNEDMKKNVNFPGSKELCEFTHGKVPRPFHTPIQKYKLVQLLGQRI